MRSLDFTIALILCGSLVACGAPKRAVPVLSVERDNTIVNKIQKVIPDSIPAGVTAICVDGSYSQSTDKSACVGNGGVQTFIDRYYSE